MDRNERLERLVKKYQRLDKKVCFFSKLESYLEDLKDTSESKRLFDTPLAFVLFPVFLLEDSCYFIHQIYALRRAYIEDKLYSNLKKINQKDVGDCENGR